MQLKLSCCKASGPSNPRSDLNRGPVILVQGARAPVTCETVPVSHAARV